MQSGERAGDAVRRGLVGGRNYWSCILIMTAWTLGIRGQKVGGVYGRREGTRPDGGSALMDTSTHPGVGT